MPMVPFAELFEDPASWELKGVDLEDTGPVGEESEIPDGRYWFLESYCDEAGCDCRRVFLNVVRDGSDEILATISYGWEEAGFYRKWMGGATTVFGRKMAAPTLATMCPQSKYAPLLLDLFRDVVLDPDYLGRLRRHYEMFKDAVDKRHHRKEGEAAPTQVTRVSVGRNDPCPCGSGRKYKKCCGG